MTFTQKRIFRLLIDDKVVKVGTLEECREKADGIWVIQFKASDVKNCWIAYDWSEGGRCESYPLKWEEKR